MASDLIALWPLWGPVLLALALFVCAAIDSARLLGVGRGMQQ